MDPDLANDTELRANLQLLSDAFEARLKALTVAHEMAQQTLIAEARLRKTMPFDVEDLMMSAANHQATNGVAKKAMESAAVELPAAREIIEAVESGTFLNIVAENRKGDDDNGALGTGDVDQGSGAWSKGETRFNFKTTD